MNIVFWANDNAHAACSINALAMAFWQALSIEDESDERVSFIQSGFMDFSSDFAILGPQVLQESYFGTGMDNLLSIARSRELVYEDAYNSSFSLADKNMLYYIASRQMNRESFEQIMGKLPELIEGLNAHVDYNYIDLMHGESDLADRIISKADIVVINVSQNELVLQESVKAAERLMKEELTTKQKLRFCVGNYEPSSIFSLKNIVKRFPIMRGKLFCIPRNTDFLDAIGTGRVNEYFMKNSGSLGRYKGVSDQHDFFDTLQKNLDYFEKEG